MSKNVTTIASDPNFEVEKFFYYLDLHEGEPYLTSTLISDPYILLSLAGSINHKILERHARDRGFDSGVFKKLEQLGFEVWTKSTESKNIWYGVIAADDLAISYRNVMANGEMEVFQGESAAIKAKARWNAINMHKVGEQNSKKAPGCRDIDFIRAEVILQLKSLGYENRWAGFSSPERAEIHLTRRRNGGGSWSFDELKFAVAARGPYTVQVQMGKPIVTATTDITRLLDEETKNCKSPPSVAMEIIKWLGTHDSILKSILPSGAT